MDEKVSGFRMGRLDHVHIRVPDRAEAARWYAEHLGFEPVKAFDFWATGFEGGPLQISADGGRTMLALFEASEGHPKGDRNNNGVLDAGDLILNFSDGVDDDDNGYVDDISGWDFMKDDNDPYDDTRYGHGTDEARDSVSRADNGIGSAGGCSDCRFIAMRVGDSFITDVNDFAQAKAARCEIG